MFENIDTTKLSRDYKQTPLKRGEIISEQDLRYLFLNLNYSRDEIAKYLDVGTALVRRSLTFYKLKKPLNLIREKSEHNCLVKYGTKTPLACKEIRQKTVETVKERYGVSNPFASKEVKDKICQTNLAKYGAKNPQSNPDIKKKSIETMRKKYGVASGMQCHIINKEVWLDNDKLLSFIKAGNNGKKWRTVDLAEEFNIAYSTVQTRIGELNAWAYIDTNNSKYEEEIKDLLISWGCDVSKFRDKHFELDIVEEKNKIAIEFNGNYWHSTRVRPDTNYHKNKSIEAQKRGYFLYHIFEYEWKNNKEQIINHLRNLLHLNTIAIYARKCTIKEVLKEEGNSFLLKNHIQGFANSIVRLGLYYKNELVSIMTFGKSRFNKNADWELVRFCSKAGYNVVGGASKLFKHFIKTYSPKSVISYSDIAKTTGNLYKVLGFKILVETDPRYVWVNHDKIYTRYQCQKKHLIKNNLGNNNQTEKEIMESHNFFQIYDCGRRTHLWTPLN